MPTHQKILITGSSGYLGNFLAVHFASKGIDVVGLDISPALEPPKGPDPKHFRFHKCDIRDRDQLVKIFSEEQPTHVIHMAYLMDPIHDKKKHYDIDVNGSKYALEAANGTESVKQFILWSSASIYGADKKNPEWFNEESPLEPRDYTYAIHKKEIEEWYGQYKRRSDLKLVTVRMCTAIGPSYYKEGGVVSSLANGPVMIQVGPRRNAVQFIHEDDVKNLTEKIVEDEEIEGVYNLGADSFSYADQIAAALGKRIFRVPLPLMSFAFWLLWNLRLAAYTPPMAKLVAYPIAAHPKKLLDRYTYTLGYSTQEALLDTIKKRRENGTL